MNTCAKCGQPSYVKPLHGERGGPLMCPICIGAWNAEFTKRRKWGRIVIRAMNMYLAEGGRWKDLDRLKLAAGGAAYLIAPEYSQAEVLEGVPDITSELLADILQLVHPDRHPPERQDMAKRITQELLALKPFVFPAPKPEPAPTRDDYAKQSRRELKQPSRDAYPCELCADISPQLYCDKCKAKREEEKAQRKAKREQERQKRNERARTRYAGRRKWERGWKPRPVCATCNEEFVPKRSDAKYCSPTCRQKAYRARDGKPSNAEPPKQEDIEQLILSAFSAEPDRAFTTRELSKCVFPGSRIERRQLVRVRDAAKRIVERQWREALETSWDWLKSELQGKALVFFNTASIMSYGQARLKSGWLHANDPEEELRKSLEPGGRDHHLIADGGHWRRHLEMHIAERLGKTDTPDYQKLRAEQDVENASWGLSA